MAKKQKQITFDEHGMRSFKNVNDAIEYFTRNGVDERSVTILFNQTYQLNVGVFWVNLLAIDKSTDLKTIFPTDELVELFHIKHAEWKTKFDAKSIENVDETETETTE